MLEKPWWSALTCLGATFALGLVLFQCFDRLFAPSFGREALTAACAAALVASALTFPARMATALRGTWPGLLWPALVGLLAFAMLALVELRVVGSVLGLRLAVAVAILAFVFDRLAGLATRAAPTPVAAALALAMVAFLSASPVWLGPLAAAHSATPEFANAVIAVSPLSYLATMAEFDLFRSQWFYRNTPFGGIRFDYPDTMSASLAYAAAGLFMGLFQLRFWSSLRNSTMFTFSYGEQMK